MVGGFEGWGVGFAVGEDVGADVGGSVGDFEGGAVGVCGEVTIGIGCGVGGFEGWGVGGFEGCWEQHGVQGQVWAGVFVFFAFVLSAWFN